MYQLDLIQQLRRMNLPAQESHRETPLSVSANVWRLGFTSLFTDVSSEMVSSILPLYFVSYLQFNSLQFGILDGIYQGAAIAVFSLSAGLLADRWRRPKEIAVAGYGLSAISKLVLLLAGSRWPIAAGTLAIDRIGKGVRTAPRDAIIALNSQSGNLSTSFAVHRALDAGGAVLGPLLAFFLLRLASGGFQLVMFASFCVALIGVGLIALLVDNPASDRDVSRPKSSTPLLLTSLLRHSGFRALVLTGALLQLVTVSDGFLYLSLQKSNGAPASVFPLYAFVTASSYMLLSLPAGKLADRWGRDKIFLTGSALLVPIYILLLTFKATDITAVLVLVVLGAYYAATDGVLAAMISSALPDEIRASGLALSNTILSLSKFLSSFFFGLIWFYRSAQPPILIYLICLLPVVIIAFRILTPLNRLVDEQR